VYRLFARSRFGWRENIPSRNIFLLTAEDVSLTWITLCIDLTQLLVEPYFSRHAVVDVEQINSW